VSSTKFHKSATKDVRPFFAAASLEHAVDSAAIRLFADQPFTDVNTFTIEEQDLSRLKIAIRPNLDEDLLNGSSISRKRLGLVVTALNPFLKKTAMVHKALLHGRAPTEIEVDDEVLEQLGGGASVVIDVALCLTTALNREAGKPFLQGHWLSKKRFHLRPPKSSEDFEIDQMDDAGWIKMGFPPKTLYQVEYYSGFNEPVNKERPIAKIRIHADVYRKLAADNLPKTSRPLMSFLAAEISCQLLTASFPDWKNAEKAEPRSPLSAFVKRIARVVPCTLKQLSDMVTEPGVPKLRAVLHADQDSVRRVAEV
jgi:hypothetical protein